MTAINTKMKFKHVRPGRIFYNERDTAFFKLPIAKTGTPGSCCKVSGVWNASNFTNDVHFCPNHEVIETRYSVKMPI